MEITPWLIYLKAGEGGYAFHSYVKIHYAVPKIVQRLTGVTNRTIKSLGHPFREVMDGLVELLQAQSETIPIIIALGGYLHAFPILPANCIKRNYDWTPLAGCMFVDSMRILQNNGYKRPGVDALYQDLNIKRNSHSNIRRCLYIKNCL